MTFVDEEAAGLATLQDGAAIDFKIGQQSDFLLLSRGRGCEDLEGLCCFNLSWHSSSIQANRTGLLNQVKLR